MTFPFPPTPNPPANLGKATVGPPPLPIGLPELSVVPPPLPVRPPPLPKNQEIPSNLELQGLQGKTVARKGSTTRTGKKAWLIVGVLAVLVLALFIIGNLTKHNTSEDTIPYEVLRKEKRRIDDKLFLEILVSERATKKDILRLATTLRSEHDGKFAHILIFDSKEAWQRHKDDSYPEKQLSRHWLVVIAGDLGQEIRWVAEGRDH